MPHVVRNRLFAIALTFLVMATVAAQEKATLLLRSGERLSAQLIDMGGVGFNIVVNGQERQVPVGDVAAIEFDGPGGFSSAAEPARPAETRPGLWLRNGEIIEGQLYDIDGTSPLHITLRTENGDRRFSSTEVRRIVLAPAANAVGTSGALATTSGTGIDVPGSSGWIPTGIFVKPGEVLTFSTTGQVQLSADAEDVASAAGARSRRVAADGPLPDAVAGALIAKVGDGPPFPIADAASATMPAAGQLFLGINDGRPADNTGSFRVTVKRTPAR